MNFVHAWINQTGNPVSFQNQMKDSISSNETEAPLRRFVEQVASSGCRVLWVGAGA